MHSIRHSFWLLAFAMPTLGAGQCQLCAPTPHTKTTTATELKPLTIDVQAALDFSSVAQLGGSGGRVTVDPRTGMRTVSGALKDLGGGTLRGEVRVQGEPMRPIRVSLPQHVTLTSSDGGSVEVTRITTNLAPNPVLGSDGSLNFDFGGDLSVTIAKSGDYHGRIPITVEYQ